MSQIRKAAQRFLETQASAAAPPELGPLLGRTAEHLVERFRLGELEAHEVALSAWSEIEGRKSRCYVDLRLSTPHLIFLVDPVAGTRRPIPTVDLVRMLGPRPVQGGG